MARKMRVKLMGYSEKHHGFFHLLFCVIAYTLGFAYEPGFFALHGLKLFIIALIGTYLPDIDHFAFIFGYGRKSNYASTCRKFIRNKDLKGFLTFVKGNHKLNTGIYSHNIGSVFLVIFFTFYELNRRDNIFMYMFFLAWTFHYIYDILEDLLFFKKPNKNWFFLFNR